MSEEVPISEPTVAHSPANFLAQYRLAIIGAGVFVLVVVFLLVGIAIGMTKKNFEKKFYLTQIEKLKDTLSSSLEKRTELEKEISEQKIELRAKKDHIAELEDKVAALERVSQRSEPAASDAHPSKAADTTAAVAGSAPDPGEAYLRLKAGDCLVEGSGGNTAANWRECLKKGKKTAATDKPAAAGH